MKCRISNQMPKLLLDRKDQTLTVTLAHQSGRSIVVAPLSGKFNGQNPIEIVYFTPGMVSGCFNSARGIISLPSFESDLMDHLAAA